MKKFLLILLVFLFSCEVDPLQVYPYDPNQPVQIQVDVYPMEDVTIQLSVWNNMRKEVNADYFNRYGMNVNFDLMENIPFPEDIKNTTNLFIPPEGTESKYEMKLYIIPYELMEPGTAGYAIGGRNSIVISATSIYGTTIPHEIGHILHLAHYPEWMNVMYPLSKSGLKGEPKEFLEQQVDTMLNALKTNKRLELEAIIRD
jgi:hypothetical protein